MSIFGERDIDPIALAKNNIYTVKKKKKKALTEARRLLLCLISAVASIEVFFLSFSFFFAAEIVGGISAMVQYVHNEPASGVSAPVNSVCQDAEPQTSRPASDRLCGEHAFTQ